MRILGIDPGLIRLGLGALEYKDDKTSIITYGLIANPRGEEKWNEFLTTGIHQICNDFPRVLDATQPHRIVAELVPPGRLGSNSDSVMAAITVCKVFAYQFGIPWHWLAASTIKSVVAGDSRATKTRIRNRMMEEFDVVKVRHAELKAEQKQSGLKTVGLPYDVTDALAVAWTYIQKEKENQLKDA